jgi:excisionase family DNA binding protein
MIIGVSVSTGCAAYCRLPQYAIVVAMSHEPIKWITIADAAERLSVSPRTIRRFISDGRLPGYRIGGPRGRLLRVEQADVDALLRRIPTAGSWQ